VSFSDPRSIAFIGASVNTATRQAVRYLPASVSALKPANDFTFSAWFRTTLTDTGGSEILSMGDNYLLRLRRTAGSSDGGVPTTYALQYSKLYQSGVLADGGATTSFADCIGPASSTPTFLDGNWHHFAGVQSSTTGMSMYFDGALVTVTPGDGGAPTTCASAAAAANTNNIFYSTGRFFYVGRNGNTSANFDFDGNIDEVRVYSRVLTPAELLTLAQGGDL
jgi:hypothetical protein